MQPMILFRVASTNTISYLYYLSNDFDAITSSSYLQHYSDYIKNFVIVAVSLRGLS